MNSKQRRQAIVDLLEQQQQISVDALAELFTVSRETVRRDLSMLAEQGLIRKVHGGAVHLQTATETAFRQRTHLQLDEKQRIGRCAARLFHPGDSLFIDAGSTTALFAEALSLRSGLTVITNSVAVATALSRSHNDTELYLLGGHYEGEVAETVGPQTIAQIRRFHTDYAVLTIGALDAQGGCMDYNIDEASVAQAMIDQARSVVVLADHTKLERKALVSVCALTTVARLVTDRQPPPELQLALEEAGVEIFIPEMQES